MNRALRLVPAALVALGIYLLSDRSYAVPMPSGLAELLSVLVHVIEYAALALALRWALSSPRLVLLLAFIYGMTDEFHQSFVPGRHATPLDLIPNVAGAIIGLLLYELLLTRTASSRTVR